MMAKIFSYHDTNQCQMSNGCPPENEGKITNFIIDNKGMINNLFAILWPNTANNMNHTST